MSAAPDARTPPSPAIPSQPPTPATPTSAIAPHTARRRPLLLALSTTARIHGTPFTANRLSNPAYAETMSSAYVSEPARLSSSRSSLVTPAATPVSISCWVTRRRTDSRETPSDSATWT